MNFNLIILISGSQGRAYLFNSVVNVGCGPAEERWLFSSISIVDIGEGEGKEREQERESENLVLQKRGVLFFLHRREVSFFFFIEVSDGNREKKMREEREKDIVKVQCCRREVSFFIRMELGRRTREMEEKEKVR